MSSNLNFMSTMKKDPTLSPIKAEEVQWDNASKLPIIDQKNLENKYLDTELSAIQLDGENFQNSPLFRNQKLSNQMYLRKCRNFKPTHKSVQKIR